MNTDISFQYDRDELIEKLYLDNMLLKCRVKSIMKFVWESQEDRGLTKESIKKMWNEDLSDEVQKFLASDTTLEPYWKQKLLDLLASQPDM